MKKDLIRSEQREQRGKPVMQVCFFWEEKGDCLLISIGGGDNMRKALIFLFDGFAEFEVNIASLFLISKQFEIITATVDGKNSYRRRRFFVSTTCLY